MNETGQFQPAGLAKKEIFEIAEALAVKLGFDQVSDNVSEVVERLGGAIELEKDLMKLDSSGGKIEIRGPRSFTISVSPLSSATRDRFTIAHEIGHYVLHSQFGKYTGILERNLDSQPIEWEANSFAAAFLMPLDKIVATIHEIGPFVSELAMEFKVSEEAMEYRLKTLRESGLLKGT